MFDSRVTENPIRELTSNKHKYSTAQNDVVIGLGRPLFGSSILSTRKKAYPSVVATLGPMRDEIRRFIAAQNFLVQDYTDMAHIKNEVVKILECCDPGKLSAYTFSHQEAAKKLGFQKREAEMIKNMITNLLEMHFVGISLGFAYSHPNAGDTVASTMIGGLRYHAPSPPFV